MDIQKLFEEETGLTTNEHSSDAGYSINSDYVTWLENKVREPVEVNTDCDFVSPPPKSIKYMIMVSKEKWEQLQKELAELKSFCDKGKE